MWTLNGSGSCAGRRVAGRPRLRPTCRLRSTIKSWHCPKSSCKKSVLTRDPTKPNPLESFKRGRKMEMETEQAARILATPDGYAELKLGMRLHPKQRAVLRA